MRRRVNGLSDVKLRSKEVMDERQERDVQRRQHAGAGNHIQVERRRRTDGRGDAMIWVSPSGQAWLRGVRIGEAFHPGPSRVAPTQVDRDDEFVVLDVSSHLCCLRARSGSRRVKRVVLFVSCRQQLCLHFPRATPSITTLAKVSSGAKTDCREVAGNHHRRHVSIVWDQWQPGTLPGPRAPNSSALWK